MRRTQKPTKIGAIRPSTSFLMDYWKKGEHPREYWEAQKMAIDQDRSIRELEAAEDIEAPSEFLVWLFQEHKTANLLVAILQNPNIAVKDALALIKNYDSRSSIYYENSYNSLRRYEMVNALVGNPAFDMMSLEHPGLLFELLSLDGISLPDVLKQPNVEAAIGAPQAVLTFKRAQKDKLTFGLGSGFLPDEVKIYHGLVTVTYNHEARSKKSSGFHFYPDLDTAIAKEAQMPKIDGRRMTAQELIAISDDQVPISSLKEMVDPILLRIASTASVLAPELNSLRSAGRDIRQPKTTAEPFTYHELFVQRGVAQRVIAFLDAMYELCAAFPKRPFFTKLGHRIASCVISSDFPVDWSRLYDVERDVERIGDAATSFAKKEYTAEEIRQSVADSKMFVDQVLLSLSASSENKVSGRKAPSLTIPHKASAHPMFRRARFPVAKS